MNTSKKTTIAEVEASRVKWIGHKYDLLMHLHKEDYAKHSHKSPTFWVLANQLIKQDDHDASSDPRPNFKKVVKCVYVDKNGKDPSIYTSLQPEYDSFDALPEWARERIALLEVMSNGVEDTALPGVGVRASRDCYWLQVEERDGKKY